MSRSFDIEALQASIPAGVQEVCSELAAAGHQAWVVGGCVRDRLLGRNVSDWDIACSAEPKQVKKVFRKVIPTGIDHGTVTVLWKGEGYEVTTLRGEGAYTDGRRPDEVFFVKSIEEDLARRDFTVNALAFDLIGGELVDPHGGLADLQARRLRAVGVPSERFSEDGLRILRGARFVATLEFELEPATEAAFGPCLDIYAKVSPERVREEWLKALKAREPSRAFEVMSRTGILARTCPALVLLRGADRDGQDAWNVTMRAMDISSGGEARLAALLHDVGRSTGKKSGSIAEQWLRDFRFSNDERKTLVHVVDVLPGVPSATASEPALRRFIQRATRTHLDRVLDLAEALAEARGEGLEELRALRVRLEDQSDAPITVGELPIRGADVIERLGKPGRAVGELLRELLELALDDPSCATRESMLRELDERVAARNAEASHV